MTEPRIVHPVFVGLALWLRILSAPVVLAAALVGTYNRLWPGHTGWDFNGDGVVTVSDVRVWFNSLVGYPAHQFWLDFAPKLAAFFEMDRHAEDFLTPYAGALDWMAFTWLVWLMAFSTGQQAKP